MHPLHCTKFQSIHTITLDMAALLRRLPSFRRSVSGTSDSQQLERAASRNSVDGNGVNGLSEDAVQAGGWTVEEATSHIASLEIDDLRRLLSDLSEKNSTVREAMQKHAKEQAGRPGLPHSSHSMSKKRRADSELDRTVETPAVTIVNSENMATDSPKKPSPPTQGADEPHAIEGQTGLVAGPPRDLLATVQGVEATELSPDESKAAVESSLEPTPSKKEGRKHRKSKSRGDETCK